MVFVVWQWKISASISSFIKQLKVDVSSQAHWVSSAVLRSYNSTWIWEIIELRDGQCLTGRASYTSAHPPEQIRTELMCLRWKRRSYQSSLRVSRIIPVMATLATERKQTWARLEECSFDFFYPFWRYSSNDSLTKWKKKTTDKINCYHWKLAFNKEESAW